MVDFPPSSLLEKIESLLNQGIGDISRLEHVKKSIVENKKLYDSDIRYVEELGRKRLDIMTENKKNHTNDSDNSCWKCGKKLVPSAKFCSFCGVDQNQRDSEFAQALSRRLKREYNPLRLVSNLLSYQILAIIGGFASIIPILIATSNIDRILELIQFYTGRDLSELAIGFIVLGGASVVLTSLVVVFSFWIKKPKTVGRILFFSSFGILILSLLVGIAGFVIILSAGILALKRRY